MISICKSPIRCWLPLIVIPNCIDPFLCSITVSLHFLMSFTASLFCISIPGLILRHSLFYCRYSTRRSISFSSSVLIVRRSVSNIFIVMINEQHSILSIDILDDFKCIIWKIERNKMFHSFSLIISNFKCKNRFLL